MRLSNTVPFYDETDISPLSYPVIKLKLSDVHSNSNSMNETQNNTQNNNASVDISTECNQCTSVNNESYLKLTDKHNSMHNMAIATLYETHENEYDIGSQISQISEETSYDSHASQASEQLLQTIQPSEQESILSEQTRHSHHQTFPSEGNLILLDGYDKYNGTFETHSITDSISDSMSDTAETHDLTYTLNTEMKQINDINDELLCEEDVTNMLQKQNHNNMPKSRNLSDIIINANSQNTNVMLSADNYKMDFGIKKIGLSLSTKSSNPEIMRLQQQLSNLSEKLKATQQLHRQIQLLQHSPLIISNKTQRIGLSPNQSGSMTSFSNQSNTTESVILDDNIARLIDVPCTPAFYRYNSYQSNNTNDIFPDIDKMCMENKMKKHKNKKCKKMNKKGKKYSKKIMCDSVAERKYLKKKKNEKKKKTYIWQSFRCFDLRICMQNTKKNVNLCR